MKENYTDITIVLDRSGSMEAIKDDAIGGFNQFLKDQGHVPGEATVTLAQFNDTCEMVYEGRCIKEAPLLNHHTYCPCGSTALRDAIGRNINRTGARLRNMPWHLRPSKVIFVIQTDGEENSSTKYHMADINRMINHQRDVYKWEFVFLGANQDAIAEASKYGIGHAHAITYQSTRHGVNCAFASVSKNIANYRTGATSNVLFTEEDRAKQNEQVS